MASVDEDSSVDSCSSSEKFWGFKQLVMRVDLFSKSFFDIFNLSDLPSLERIISLYYHQISSFSVKIIRFLDSRPGK